MLDRLFQNVVCQNSAFCRCVSAADLALFTIACLTVMNIVACNVHSRRRSTSDHASELTNLHQHNTISACHSSNRGDLFYLQLDSLVRAD